MRLRYAPLLIAFLLMLPTFAPQATRADDAATVLAQSATTMAAVKSFAFDLTTANGTTKIMEGFEISSITGLVQRPDRFRAEITVKIAVVSLTIKAIGIGDRLWITDPTAATETYFEVPGGNTTDGANSASSLSALINPERILLQAATSIQNPEIAGQEDLNGVTTTKITGTFDIGKLIASATPTPEASNDLFDLTPKPVTVWIDESGRVLRLEMQGALVKDEDPKLIRRLDLRDFDAETDIQPPA